MDLIIYGIDPGQNSSGLCIYDATEPGPGKIAFAGSQKNEDIIDILRDVGPCIVAIEAMKCYGMAIGDSTIESCYAIGRFQQVAGDSGAPVRMIPRKTICTELCGKSHARDANISQALRDIYGPRGTKKNQGPTYGIASHGWSALAVAHVARVQILRAAGIKLVA